jgi:hypothetical protein
MEQQAMRFSPSYVMNEDARLGMSTPASACKALQDQVLAVFRSYKPSR